MLATEINNRIYINEDELDLFDSYTGVIPDWKPKTELPPFTTLKIIYIDIETTGLSFDKDRITLIGLMNEIGDHMIISSENEAEIIATFLRIFEKKKPDILAGFNHIEFDLKFIISRAARYGIKTPFNIAKKTTTIRTAIKFGQPVTYFAVWCRETAIIDLYHQVLMWDNVKRKLTSHTLKQSVLQMGLRKQERLELSYWEMMEEWNNRSQNKLKRLKEYLVYDLEDSKLLGDYLLPAVYYQKIFLPDWKLQSISTAGNGSKWNDILKKEYPGYLPETDPIKKYEGGLTGAIAGFFLNVIKFDVASLYPSIMGLYGIHSRKDFKKIMLGILKYLKEERIRLKDIANFDVLKAFDLVIEQFSSIPTQEEITNADQAQGSLKVILNSAYGALGTGGIEFNDYTAAAMVTAYGRAILKLMNKVAKENGGVVIEADTDGLMIQVEPGKEKELHEIVQAAMPPGIIVEWELHAVAFYDPPLNKDKYDFLVAADVDENGDDSGVVAGLRKNYIIFYSKDKYKATGKYRKRNKSVLEKSFTPEYLRRYIDSPESAEEYYQQIIKSLRKQEYPIEGLAITRKISKSEKKLVEMGIGEPGDVVTIYRTTDQIRYGVRGQPLKHPQEMWTKDGICNYQPYVKMIQEQYEEIKSCL